MFSHHMQLLQSNCIFAQTIFSHVAFAKIIFTKIVYGILPKIKTLSTYYTNALKQLHGLIVCKDCTKHLRYINNFRDTLDQLWKDIYHFNQSIIHDISENDESNNTNADTHHESNYQCHEGFQDIKSDPILNTFAKNEIKIPTDDMMQITICMALSHTSLKKCKMKNIKINVIVYELCEKVSQMYQIFVPYPAYRMIKCKM